MTMTKLEQATRRAIREWCEAQGHTVEKINHVFPRAYVVAHTAPSCLVIARPPMDATKHLRALYDETGGDGSATCHTFDKSLKVGDWCSIAYVTTIGWGGPVAIPAVIVEV